MGSCGWPMPSRTAKGTVPASPWPHSPTPRAAVPWSAASSTSQAHSIPSPAPRTVAWWTTSCPLRGPPPRRARTSATPHSVSAELPADREYAEPKPVRPRRYQGERGVLQPWTVRLLRWPLQMFCGVHWCGLLHAERIGHVSVIGTLLEALCCPSRLVVKRKLFFERMNGSV